MYLFKSLISRSLSFVCITLLIASCATQEQSQSYRSFLESSNQSDSAQAAGTDSTTNSAITTTEQNNLDFKKLQLLEKVQPEKYIPQRPKELYRNISDTQLVQVTTDEMPLDRFVHYVFGELLGLNYILDPALESSEQNVTLNISDTISKRRLFTLCEELLAEKGFKIAVDKDIYSVLKVDNAVTGTVVYAYGNEVKDVPNTNLDIVQVVSFNYGNQPEVLFRLGQFAQLKAIPSQRQDAMLLQGKRDEIIKALEYIKFFDQPLLRDRYISFYQPTFITTVEVSQNLKNLLAQDGIELTVGGDLTKAVAMIEIQRTGMVIFFAQKKEVLDRVDFWLAALDQPVKGDQLQYFYYQPSYARASDLGESLSKLVGNFSGSTASSISAESENVSKSSSSTGVSRGDNLSFVIDEKTNSLVFYAKGEKYQQILPIIKRLDVLPKQVILEVMIAEVSLTNEFKQGVEFALQNGKFGLSTNGAFMGSGFGGLSYLLTGSEGQLTANFLQSNSLVNIVSRPTVVVRDGVAATIQVGTDIPVVGSTTSDPLTGQRQTTEVVYRSTGINLSVTPTINAKGVVIMEINQNISNQVDSGSTASLNPSVFQRNITTEVIAESGQTVLLGGLISENKSNKNTNVPLLGKLPILGNLFGSKTEGGDKTELVVLVTPRIINDATDLSNIKNAFYDNFSFLK